MRSLMKLFVVFSYIFLLFRCTSSSPDTCLSARCGFLERDVRFPFYIPSKQPDSCGYPGFELSCKGGDGTFTTMKTVLNLPHNGEFIVESVTQYSQRVVLSDPDKCIAKKMISYDNTSALFTSTYYQTLHLYNCSATYVRNYTSYLYEVSCLGNGKYSIIATSSPPVMSYLKKGCTFTKVFAYPSSEPNYEIKSTPLTGDLYLNWHNSDCNICISRGYACGFNAYLSNSSEKTCKPGRYTTSVSGGSGIDYSAFIGLPVGLIVLALVCICVNCIVKREEEEEQERAKIAMLTIEQQSTSSATRMTNTQYTDPYGEPITSSSINTNTQYADPYRESITASSGIHAEYTNSYRWPTTSVQPR